MRPVPKKKRNVNKPLCAWIRTLPCIFTGLSPVDCSHILTRGAGHGDENNVLPMHRTMHVRYEQLSTEKKKKLLPLAEAYTEMFKQGKTPIQFLLSWRVFK